jgi:Domain of unknown function (DUF4844)
MLKLSSEMLTELRMVRAREKFLPGLYQPPSENVLLQASAHVDALLDSLVVGLPDKPTKYYVLSEFSKTLEAYDSSDMEERERVCEYLESVMVILGIESSDGQLNTWLYGFDPNMKGAT